MSTRTGSQVLKSALAAATKTLDSIIDLESQITKAAELVTDCLTRGKTIALLGRDGGSVAGIADVDLIVKGGSTARIQEAHKFILHVLCEICEARLPRK